MIKLIDILEEIVEGKAIEVPSSELNKIDQLYNYIVDNFEKLQNSTKNKKYSNAITVDQFKFNSFKITPIKGTPTQIKILFYNDPNDDARARANVTKDVSKTDTERKSILINLGQPIEDYNQFKTVITHELIHAVDPKTTRSDIFKKFYTGKKYLLSKLPKNSRDKYEVYAKAPFEFDAFAGSIIQDIKDKLGNVQDIDKEKYKEFIYTFFTEIKNKSLEDVTNNSLYKKQMMYILATPDDERYKAAIDFLQIYMKDSKLSRRMLQMLASANVIKIPPKISSQ